LQLKQIQVESYAGGKADETPRRVLIAGEWLEVVEVVDRWHQTESRLGWPRADYFKILDPCGGLHLLKHDLEEDLWFLVRSWSVPEPR